MGCWAIRRAVVLCSLAWRAPHDGRKFPLCVMWAWTSQAVAQFAKSSIVPPSSLFEIGFILPYGCWCHGVYHGKSSRITCCMIKWNISTQDCWNNLLHLSLFMWKFLSCSEHWMKRISDYFFWLFSQDICWALWFVWILWYAKNRTFFFFSLNSLVVDFILHHRPWVKRACYHSS